MIRTAIGPALNDFSGKVALGRPLFGVSIRLHWEGYDSALALGFTGKAI